MSGLSRDMQRRATTRCYDQLLIVVLLLVQPQLCTSPSWMNLLATPAPPEYGLGGTPTRCACAGGVCAFFLSRVCVCGGVVAVAALNP